jgi:selenocysteine lyase/cysteine desulfurase
MWTRRRFLERVGSGVGVVATLRAGGIERVLAAGQAVRGRSPQEVASDEDYWYEIQQAFTVDRNTINMNNGTMQPSLRVVEEAMQRNYEFSANAGIHTTDYFSHDLEIVRRRLAKHAGCSPEELALTRGGSEAGQIAVMGIDLKPGDEVLTTDYDYPRFLNSLRQRELREGIVLRKIALPPPPVPFDVFYRRIEEAITPKTRVLLVCHMTHWTAQMAPIKRLATLARAHDLHYIVDGAHGFMQVPINVVDYDCDYYIASLHKWLMAPPGNGFLYVRKARIPTLWPLTPADEKQKNDIRKFEDVGTRTQANRVVMAEALTFNEGIGIERKTARLRYLKERWANRLKANPRVTFLTSLDPAESCAIATINIAGVDMPKMAATLHDEHGIVVSHMKHERFEGFRVVPNIHMTIGELDYFSDVLEEVIRKMAA